MPRSVAAWRTINRTATDVVVVGSGAAGMNAALHAAAGGARVVLLDKGSVGRSGASIQANVFANAAPRERWETHAQDILTVGAGLAEPELAAMLAREAEVRFLEWLDWGVRFELDDHGQLLRKPVRGHSEPRAVSPGYGMGERVCRVLRKRIRRASVITCLPYTPAVEILTRDGEVTGLLAWDQQAGTWLVVESPSVVLATGGAQGLYERATTSPHLTGDGFALAQRAGARLRELEFVLFVPVGIVSPRPIAISPTTIETIRKVAGHLLDANGRRFAGEYTEGADQAPWEQLSRALAQAAVDGRTFDDDSVTFVADEDERRAIRERHPDIADKLEQRGLDVQAGVRVGRTTHFFPGGVAIDPNAESVVPGLFAAGEAAGGVHGATRQSGDAFTSAAVFGAKAGRCAAARATARGRGVASVGSGELASDAARHVDAWLERVRGPDGEPPRKALRRTRARMERAAGALRDGPTLAASRDKVAVSPGYMLLGPDPAMNTEFGAALEARNQGEVARALLDAALARRTSLGAHYRTDAPEPVS